MQKDFWEKTASKFAISGYKAVCTPTSIGLVNRYADFLQRTALKPIFNECRGARVLDVGCGVGRWSSRLLKVGADVTGIDVSENMVKEASSRLRSQNSDAKLLISAAARLPFRDSVFDRVLSVTVLQHIVDEDELTRSVSELTRVTKAGGKITILEISPQERRDTVLDFPTSFRSTDEWIALFTEDPNIELERIKGIDLSLFKRPLDRIKGRLSSGVEYSNQLSAERPRVKFRAVKAAWYVLLNMAILLSLPFDLMLRNKFPQQSSHKLFIFKRLSPENRERP